MLAELRQRLQALQKPAGIENGPGVLPLGLPDVDGALGGGLARGALHEIAAAGEAHLAAAAGFVLGLISSPSPRLREEGRGEGPSQIERRGEPPSPVRHRSAPAGDLSPHSSRNGERSLAYAGRGKQVVWIAEDMALAESGAPYGPGLDAFNLPPERLLSVATAHRRDLLWAMEEALRCRAVGAVIGEVRHGDIDIVAVRRLSLAAAETGALALLLRAKPVHDASTAATRWIVGASPSLGGESNARFAAHLVRNRRGPTASWILEWSDLDECFALATHSVPLAAPAFDRPHHAHASRKIA